MIRNKLQCDATQADKLVFSKVDVTHFREDCSIIPLQVLVASEQLISSQNVYCSYTHYSILKFSHCLCVAWQQRQSLDS